MTLTTQPTNAALDLTDGYGQRSETFRFELVNGASGIRLGTVTPLRTGSLSHDIGRTVKRSLTLTLGVADTAAINPVSDRLDVYAVINGTEYPLGRYVFTDASSQRWTSGSIGNMSLVDEMFIIDQELETGYSARSRGVGFAIQEVLADFAYTKSIAASPYISAEAWAAGTRRGQVLATLATTGDYFTPWFTNDRVLTFIRSFDPATQVPAFDFDAGNQVLRAGIVESNDLLSAPNRFVVISNAATDGQIPATGSVDVPASAPHSIQNRGFVIPKIVDLQVTDRYQATAIAKSLSIQESPLEYVNIGTALDPRHDAYDVIFWDGQLWLEVAWSIQLTPGGVMSHTLQKVYS